MKEEDDDDEIDEGEPEIAVINRGRRSTAGKRMNSLVGKAIEDDEAFWGHDTWIEDDSGNESFHESDEDSELQKDRFDSDFDDSESDHNEEEEEDGRNQEVELQKAERQARQLQRKKGSGYVDATSSHKKQKQQQQQQQRGLKRVVGDGINAGIVLNFPPSVAAKFAAPGASPLAPLSSPHALNVGAASDCSKIPLLPAAAPLPSKKSSNKQTTSVASERPRRSTAATRRSRVTRGSLSSNESLNETVLANAASGIVTAPKTLVTPLAVPDALATGIKSVKRKRFKQEELLLEAVNKTEPENERWLLARKRVQDLAEKDKETAAFMLHREKARGSVVQKYHSRRGCLISLTFPSMEAVPELLTRPNAPPLKPNDVKCVITGKKARYRDPKTKLAYYDADAFKELRRRWESRELPKKPSPKLLKPSPSPDPPTSSSSVLKPAAPPTLPVVVSSIPSQETISATADATASAKLTTAVTPTASLVPPNIVEPTEVIKPGGVHDAKLSQNDAPALTPTDDPPDDLVPFPEGRRSKRKWAPSIKALQNLSNESSPPSVKLRQLLAGYTPSEGKPVAAPKKQALSTKKKQTAPGKKPFVQQAPPAKKFQVASASANTSVSTNAFTSVENSSTAMVVNLPPSQLNVTSHIGGQS